MKIDSHATVPPDFIRYKVKIFENVTVESYLKKMEELNINRAVVWSVARSPDEVTKVNDWVAKLTHDYPDKFIGFANVYPPRLEEALAELERAITKLSLVGLKLHPTVQLFMMNDPSVIAIIDRAKEYDIPVVLHVASPAYRPFPDHLGAFAQEVVDSESSNPYSSSALLASIVKHYNSRKVFSAHLGGIYSPEIEQSKISFQTVGACVSAIEYAYRVVGADRIVFGSDYPFFDPAEEIKKIRRANIPEKAKEKILGKNMEELLG